MDRIGRTLTPGDRPMVLALLEKTGFFSRSELRVAREVVDDALTRGRRAGYRFVLARRGTLVTGFCCFGPIPCTVDRFDCYWIAVHPAWQHRGIGRRLLRCAEQAVVRSGGKRLYCETSSRPQYAPTRRFYRSCGYGVDAVCRDFYRTGDHKVIFRKEL